MSTKKLEKKRVKLQERIAELEAALALNLQKKSSSAAEIDVPGSMRRIAELKLELAELG